MISYLDLFILMLSNEVLSGFKISKEAQLPFWKNNTSSPQKIAAHSVSVNMSMYHLWLLIQDTFHHPILKQDDTTWQICTSCLRCFNNVACTQLTANDVSLSIALTIAVPVLMGSITMEPPREPWTATQQKT